MSDDIKDRLLASLLQPKGNQVSGAKLIEEIIDSKSLINNETAAIDCAQESVNQAIDEGPTMMELMMEAQREAQKAKSAVSESEVVKEKKSFGGGFKKGFFGGSTVPSSKHSNSSTNTTNTSSSSHPEFTNSDIPTITKKSGSTVNSNKVSAKIVEEVQEALKEDENPMLAKLKTGDWVTPDLVQQFQSNPIVARGLNNPKCQAAIQAMQKNPNEAKKKFGDDPEVDLFMREFGKLMSAHFESLGSTSDTSSTKTSSITSLVDNNSSRSSSNSSSSSSKASVIQEVGPLQAQAMKKLKLVDDLTHSV